MAIRFTAEPVAACHRRDDRCQAYAAPVDAVMPSRAGFAAGIRYSAASG